MPIGELVTEVTIDGGNRLGGINLNTDRNGAVTITGIVVPYSEPGFYPVKIVVGTGGSAETAIVQLEILAESDVRGVSQPAARRRDGSGRQRGTDIPLQHQQQGLDVLRPAP